MELHIKTVSVAAACLMSGKKDVRYYLNGVRIKSEAGLVVVQSTNGNMAFEDAWYDQEAPEFDLIIPLDIAKDLGKINMPLLALTGPDEAGRYTCGGRVFKPVDGRYPDMSRVMIDRDSANDHLKSDYDFEQLYICQKAMRIATGKKNGMWRIQNSPNGRGGLIYRENDKWPRCIIAPWRDKAFENN